jgi:hypothetical protein
MASFGRLPDVTPGDVLIMVAAALDGVCVVTATRAG